VKCDGHFGASPNHKLIPQGPGSNLFSVEH